MTIHLQHGFPGTILEILIKKFAKNIFKSIFLQTKVLF